MSAIRMRDDHMVEMRHTVSADDTFESAARDVFRLLQEAEQRYPGGLRLLTIDIEGHRGARAGYDADFFEFQQEFMLGSLGRFFTAIEMPLTGRLGNPEPQSNDLPDRLKIND